MDDWLFALPLLWMTLVIFAAAYLVAAGVYLVVVGLAVNGRASVFKAFSPQMLTPLGVIFGLLVGFVAMQTWNDFDEAKVAVVTEASALKAVVLFDESLPEEQRTHLRTLINRHIDEAVTLFATGIALSALLIAAYSRPFTGDNSVGPELFARLPMPRQQSI